MNAPSLQTACSHTLLLGCKADAAAAQWQFATRRVDAPACQAARQTSSQTQLLIRSCCTVAMAESHTSCERAILHGGAAAKPMHGCSSDAAA